jgi:hypothetical protein
MYCAPEAWLMNRNEPAMDMYSMGIVFYELATLNHPYVVSTTGDIIENWKNAHLSQATKDPRELNHSLDLCLAQMIIKMMAKRPCDRYHNWEEVLDRVSLGTTDSKAAIDTSGLIEQLMKKRQEQERVRLAAEDRARQYRDYIATIEGAFAEVRTAAEETVRSFNQSTDLLNLAVHGQGTLGFSIQPIGGRGGSVTVAVQAVSAGMKLQNENIKAWGIVKAPSGRGFNLVLTTASYDDLYGCWRTLHVNHGGLVMRTDPRPEPFPFELKELPKEIPLIGGLHIYSTTIGTFDVSMFLPLIEELMA